MKGKCSFNYLHVSYTLVNYNTFSSLDLIHHNFLPLIHFRCFKMRIAVEHETLSLQFQFLLRLFFFMLTMLLFDSIINCNSKMKGIQIKVNNRPINNKNLFI